MNESKPCGVKERAAKIIEKTSDHYGLPGEHEGLTGLSRHVTRQLHRELQQQPRRIVENLQPSKRTVRTEGPSEIH